MSGGIETRYATLAYGSGEAVYRQASMLLISLLAFAPEPRELVAVTDHPERFDWLADVVRIHALAAEQVKAWQGPDPFSMRAKLEVARTAMPARGALILADADTLAVADPAPMVAALAGGALFMHTREFELARSRRPGNRALWRDLAGRAFGGWRFEPGDAMWNSGVIGMTAPDAPLLGRALELYDALAAAGIRHFATEQLALGLVLERTARLRESKAWFTHYWGNKAQYDAEIARRLDRARAAGRSPHEVAARLREDPIALPAEFRPGRLQKLRRWLARRS